MHSYDKKIAIERCVEIIQEASAQGVKFSLDNFVHNAQKVKS